MKLIDTVKTRIAQQQQKLRARLDKLEWLERLWDERVTRLLAEYPAHAGDCAWHRDAAREQARLVEQKLLACELALARI